MPPTVESILEQARQLDNHELAALRDALESEEQLRQVDPEVMDHIYEIAERRMREVDEGRAKMLSESEFWDALNERLGRT